MMAVGIIMTIASTWMIPASWEKIGPDAGITGRQRVCVGYANFTQGLGFGLMIASLANKRKRID